MIALLRRWRLDSYMLAIVGTVALAALIPARGGASDALDTAVHAAFALLFFLYGARITPQDIRAGIMHWRLQVLVLVTTFAVFPVIGLGIAMLTRGQLDDGLVTGLLFLSLLPSTVQSSIAFTSMAQGNVPAALCCASLSNLAGVVITPLLATALLGAAGSGTSLTAVADIALQILLPFLLGQAARPLIGGWLHRRKMLTMVVDRGSILLVVYSAFSAGVVAGLWSKVTPKSLALVIALDLAMLALVLAFTMVASRLLRFTADDEIAIVFCGSKKSLASGLPMANIIFPAGAAGLIVIPLMLFHQMQLMVCAALAQRYGRRTIRAGATGTTPT
ncbi:bile acid:sodium symporter family protein [Sphingomonas rubra]|uniref:Solute carrier family 10 (Sodium/bile acid cotransporter), member 7 n=1 Tax=Sphingomonas rubra TaxID=634430 RepID=A0A1I5UPM6_9SPHN|nr:bile acid:sodium symporter family protein [Sphingomonas rubra]SFP97189.1 solute carrier family 10 (sodium/bile acid cotransporter), member 7 [Sphingomonas rubra]